MRGPIISPRLIKSRMAISRYWSAPRSRTVVTPDSRVRIAPFLARNSSIAGGLLVSCLSMGSPGISSVYMVMCVCASISPGNPVYFERSVTSAPAGTADASVVTLRIRSPSTITIAFVQSFPLASHNLPKRTTFHALALGFPWAHTPAAKIAERRIARIIRISLIAQTPSHAHTHAPQPETSNSVVAGMQSRTVAAYCWRRADCDAEDFMVEELVGGRGAATPAVCEPRPNC